jgi:hypothetical protein
MNTVARSFIKQKLSQKYNCKQDHFNAQSVTAVFNKWQILTVPTIGTQGIDSPKAQVFQNQLIKINFKPIFSKVLCALQFLNMIRKLKL